jgi:hypothetical protein
MQLISVKGCFIRTKRIFRFSVRPVIPMFCVDLQNPDWIFIAKADEKGKRHGAIATEQDRDGL